MNTPAIILATLGVTLGSLHAQTVPLLINYQGHITAGSGAPLGAAGTAPNYTSAPINRRIIFRIFDAQTGGTRLWSEQQTVTIALGEFSILFGQGTDAVYAGVTETPRPPLDTVFTSGTPNRFLEIVVDDGSGTFTAADVPITPRQRITTTAYSFRARVADTVPNLSIASTALADGAVTSPKIVDNSITTLKIADGSVTTSKIPDNAITSAKIADGSIGTADLANASVTAAKLDAGIGVWTASGGNVSRPTGNVGIGKQPVVALDVVGSIAATGNITAAGALTGSSISTTGPFAATTITANNGMAIAGTNVLQFGAGVPGREFSAGQIGYQTHSGNSLDFVGAGTTSANRRIKMWGEGGIEFVGRVGIGTATPAVPLDVIGATSLTMTDNGYQSGTGFWGGANNGTWFLTGSDSVNGAGPEVYGMSGSYNVSNDANVVAPVGIRADGWIVSAKGIVVYSDRRIKRDLHASVTGKDLAAIQQLKVTDYRMVDPADDGKAWRKGFIAQEVEKVIPGAVTRSTEYVPDIFSAATALQWHAGVNQLSLTLGKDHELKAGDRVRLHVDGSRLDLKVREVPSARSFVVENCERAPEKVLVYGKQVNDFRTVDYDRIFTTSVGALQELKKEKDAEVKILEEENAALKQRLAAQEERLAALEAGEKTRETKLAAIEKLLQSAVSTGSVSRTVSLNAAAAK
jgi:hypothetical protein